MQNKKIYINSHLFNALKTYLNIENNTNEINYLGYSWVIENRQKWGIDQLDTHLSVADSYGNNTSFICSEKTLNKIIEETQTNWKNFYKGIHRIILDNNLEFGRCIIMKGDKSETWETMIF